jgi:hypothetical protein
MRARWFVPATRSIFVAAQQNRSSKDAQKYHPAKSSILLPEPMRDPCTFRPSGNASPNLYSRPPFSPQYIFYVLYWDRLVRARPRAHALQPRPSPRVRPAPGRQSTLSLWYNACPGCPCAAELSSVLAAPGRSACRCPTRSAVKPPLPRRPAPPVCWRAGRSSTARRVAADFVRSESGSHAPQCL